MEPICVALSGGVDSSVAALLLKEQGHRLIGLFMKNWDDEEGRCTAAQDGDDVARVAALLDIPHYTLNFAAAYKELVFSYFLAELKKGNTPNPDILCNREIKFKLLLDHARQLGATHLATGHYAQITPTHMLQRAVDNSKDQTYFLYTLTQPILAQALFPIGHLPKSEVRAIAARAQLPTATKRDSTGICFIGERNFSTFLNDYLPYQEGECQTTSGKRVGTHRGVAYYTIGQRHGFTVGGAGEPWFVVGKDVANNILYVEQGKDHPALFAPGLWASEPSWVSGEQPALPFRCTAKIRYRQEDQPCTIERWDGERLWVRFDEPQRAITPAQSVVFYDGALCIGGAVIGAAA